MTEFDIVLTSEELKLINQLKNKNRMEQDEILGGFKNGKF